MSTNALRRSRLQTGGDFSAALAYAADRIMGRAEAVLDVATDLARQSIVDGSPLTGAPGQPVASGALKRSWKVRSIAKNVRVIETDSPYARVVEHDIRRMERAASAGRGRRRKKVAVRGRTYRNGGPHSLALTRVGMPRIVEEARRRVIASIR
jgi:hypothetical protein